MYLQSLTLTNIRQFEKRTFEFRPGFNLLVGTNGAGKTTILRALHAAVGEARLGGKRPTLSDDDVRLRADRAEVHAVMRSTTGRAQEFHFRKKLWGSVKRSARRPSVIPTLLYSSDEATCSAFKEKRAKRAPRRIGEVIQGSEEYLYSLENNPARASGGGDEARFGSSRSVRQFVGRALATFSPDMDTFYWRFEPYDCVVVPPEGTSEAPSLDLETLRHARAMALRALHEMSLQDDTFKWPDQSRVVLTPYAIDSDDRVPKLRDIWKELKVSSDSARQLLMACSLEVRLTPRIMIHRSVGALSLTQLSDGEKRLFSLFVDIARQLSVHGPDTAVGDGEAVVLIDEIDVHLHPKWQRRIVPALEDLFPNCQFIATTHSPFVIQATRRQNVTSIDQDFAPVRHAGGNSIEDIAEDIQGVREPQRSVRAEMLSAAAKRYFALLEAKGTGKVQISQSELREAELTYRQASEPFTSEPAAHALLTVMSMKDGAQ